MKKFTADIVYTLEGEPMPNGVIVTDEKGKILSLGKPDELSNDGAEYQKGAIVPGFINAHCHLELSHLHHKIAEGEGLIAFIKNVIVLRNEDHNAQLQAAKAADELMWENGIVAVGDICNTSLTASIKNNSKIKYHNFIEVLGMDSKNAVQILKNASLLKTEFSDETSIVPHSPYSVSKELFKEIGLYSASYNNLLSMHNQESMEENNLYQFKTGGFIQFYKDLGIDISDFKAYSKISLATLLLILPKNEKKLLVHNTFTSEEDIDLANQIGNGINWCFCPNANFYIEKKLPQITQFLQSKFPFTIGTDSLASNHSLCILSEMRTILNNFPQLNFDQVLKWSTINGAQFFGFDNVLGSIKVGKTPGLNLITHFNAGGITADSKVVKLI
jgi:cytosine/adenosine deaminase-related metal-dependent hydrolase